MPGSLMRLDQLHWLPDDVLVKADRAGMLASLELRTAYLQRELAEFAASVAPAVHLSGGGKQLLAALLSAIAPRRAAAAQGRVPSSESAAGWRGRWGQLMEDQVARGSLYTEGWVRGDVAARLLAEHRRAGPTTARCSGRCLRPDCGSTGSGPGRPA